MRKKLRNNDHGLPAKAHGKGRVWNIQFFPNSSAGKDKSQLCKGGSHNKPRNTHFQKWVDYYECVIGTYIERLNAMQFDWNPAGNLAAQADAFAVELNNFGEIIKGGSAQMVNLSTATPTPYFEWPLTGIYHSSSLDPTDSGLGGRKCRYFFIHMEFEKDPDYEMVVNVRITFSAEYEHDPSKPGGPDDTSGASSYIATSSST